MAAKRVRQSAGSRDAAEGEMSTQIECDYVSIKAATPELVIRPERTG